MYELNFNSEQCWYKSVCEHFGNNEVCNKRCIKYSEIDYLMYLSNIPKARQQPFKLIPENEDIGAFTFLNDIKKDIVNFVNKGENLYIYSNNFGNGKTSWAIKIMQEYFHRVWYGNRYRCRGLFIFVPSFLVNLKRNMTNPIEDFNSFLDRILEADLVIWDDIGANKLSDYDHTQLLTYIDQRKLNLKSNIYTGNLNYDKLMNTVGARLTSRVWNDSTVVELVGVDRRGTVYGSTPNP